MDAVPSLQQLLTQTIGLFVIGVVVYLMTRWLRFKRELWTFPNPRQSAIAALMATIHISGLVLVSGKNALTALLSSAMLIPISLLMGYIMLRTENVIAPAILHTIADWVGIFT